MLLHHTLMAESTVYIKKAVFRYGISFFELFGTILSLSAETLVPEKQIGC